MSGYFDGLMRASGLALGAGSAAAPVTAPAWQPVLPAQTNEGALTEASAVRDAIADAEAAVPQRARAPGLVSVEGQHLRAQPPDRGTASESSASPAATPLPHRAGPDASENALRQRAPSPADATTREATSPRGPAPTTVASPARPAGATERDRLIQAAMRWIAADPAALPQPDPARFVDPSLAAQLGAPGTAPRPPEAAARMDTRSASGNTAATATFHDAGAPVWDAPALTRTAPPAERTDSTLADPPSPPQARALAQALATLPASPAAPRQDPVQVTIGTIHLRVDAPAPPALQTAPAPRAAPMPAVPPRSGLSRRGLRRL